MSLENIGEENRQLPNPIDDLIKEKGCLVLDGALATELQARGCDIDGPLWSARALYENPDLIRQVHLDYFRAGADIVITATYQASVPGLHAIDYSTEEALGLMKRSVQLAQQAQRQYVLESQKTGFLIAGSIGPYGAYLADGSEYTGDYRLSLDGMLDFHRPRMKALIEAGVDILAFETIPSVRDLTGFVALLLTEFPSATAYISFTIRDKNHISDGSPLSNVMKLVNMCPQFVAVGVNCIDESKVTGALETLSHLTSKPLIAYPNSGQQYDVDSNSWTGENGFRTSLADKVAKWRSLGARVIGGCCQTSPEDIRLVAIVLKAERDSSISGTVE
ncbi:homocysteine S-methyltransferase [Rhizodiscina lignyota]|uniref:Homocysteine S-methyltransferase n=1 Tax=Rhizodiscina lignyota TaxID=1504668 RepID=A0A9P4M1T4_9PEZI|nr:homocysteine S-methyltransferase [Rhizodiscina lignyota]